MKKMFLFIIILILSSTILKGQKYGYIHFCDKWFAKTNLGVTMPWGDIEENWKGHLKFHPTFEIGIGKELNTFFSIGSGLMIGKVEGYHPSNNRYFIAEIFEYNLSGLIDFTTLSFGFNPQRKVKINWILGVGFYNYSSILKTISTDSIINTIGYDINNNKTKKKTEFIFKTGINLKFKISKQLDFIFENTWSVTGSDYLDTFKAGFSYDIYSFTSLGIAYKFNIRKNGRSFINYGVRP